MRYARGLLFGLLLGMAGSASSEPGAAPARTAHERGLASFAFTAVDVGEHRYEVTLAGTWFSSRHEIEDHLLYQAALVTIETGHDWFEFLTLPGEHRQPASAPPVSDNAGAAAIPYAAWQPHWNYYSAEFGWQPWHPEWGVRFWADQPSKRAAELFEAHAMISMKNWRIGSGGGKAFDARRVAKELKPRMGQ